MNAIDEILARKVVMRSLLPWEREFLMAAWVELERQIDAFEQDREHECSDEQMLTDFGVDDRESMIKSILRCFPEVRNANATETFTAPGSAKARKRPSDAFDPIPVWSVLRNVRGLLGATWAAANGFQEDA